MYFYHVKNEDGSKFFRKLNINRESIGSGKSQDKIYHKNIELTK